MIYLNKHVRDFWYTF